jgi:hypothetical protein
MGIYHNLEAKSLTAPPPDRSLKFWIVFGATRATLLGALLGVALAVAEYYLTPAPSVQEDMPWLKDFAGYFKGFVHLLTWTFEWAVIGLISGTLFGTVFGLVKQRQREPFDHP